MKALKYDIKKYKSYDQMEERGWCCTEVKSLGAEASTSLWHGDGPRVSQTARFEGTVPKAALTFDINCSLWEEVPQTTLSSDNSLDERTYIPH